MSKVDLNAPIKLGDFVCTRDLSEKEAVVWRASYLTADIEVRYDSSKEKAWELSVIFLEGSTDTMPCGFLCVFCEPGLGNLCANFQMNYTYYTSQKTMGDHQWNIVVSRV